MHRLSGFVFVLSLLAPHFASAQHAGEAPLAPILAAETRQFDFLLGQWDLQVHPKINSLAAMIHGTPKLGGTLKAWRILDGAGIEDEIRVVDASGNPISLNRALRIYAKADARWKVSAVDASHGRLYQSSGQMQDGEMRLQSRSSDAEGKPVITRTRYFGISADAFHMQQDNSSDNGETWEEGVLTIDAKRTAATASP
ncbi:MAG: hypothetical protein ABI846_02250 [Rudaea sp.]